MTDTLQASPLTAQEQFWRGEFGTEYIGRNNDDRYLAANIALFSKVLARTGPLASVIEFGPNVGLNLRAIATLQPDIRCTGVEINPQAAAELRAWGGCTVEERSMLEPQSLEPHDLAFTKGVLIHVAPEKLDLAYDQLVRCSRRFILVAEYYSPSPTSVPYRGHDDRLFKRDFAGELMDRHAGLSLVDYGFFWRRDPSFPMDDLTWFLLEKRA